MGLPWVVRWGFASVRCWAVLTRVVWRYVLCSPPLAVGSSGLCELQVPLPGRFVQPVRS